MKIKLSYLNTEIFYHTEGKGLPVILIHGFAEDSEVWSEQKSFLKDHCRLIIPDLPGSGLSAFENNKQENADTIEYYADVVYALLRYETIEYCLMLGHSMGGYITLAFAEKYPELLKGFGLIHSTAFADSAEKKQNRQKGISMMEEYGGYSFLKTTTPNLFAAKFKAAHPEKVETLIEKGKGFSTVALQQYYRAMMNRPDRTNILKNSNKPVLFVMGTEDVAAPLEDVLKQTYLPIISFVHILEDTGHMGMWEHPEKMNNAILEFIKNVESNQRLRL
ncbi:alpha/beta hydrolase [Panacibacter ginsenosidivorans]|uniref:Alpha/beta hydrolase n=1 Tax=Panacibacter ginsenosidivorans TaxID=1813871 RepID=A0A5B8V3U8_9BACT|nr:alpha/beta hydrolase [Panacibacter ginsenosidivorans]QEC66197.1 alpha/beta hydrolase [Panacibacter ginsenosidivorans]